VGNYISKGCNFIMGTVKKRGRGRPPKTGGWQQLSTRLAKEWEEACGLLPARHNTTLGELLSDAIAAEPLKAVQVLSTYIPKNIDLSVSAEGDWAEALSRASELLRSEKAKVIDQVIDIEEEYVDEQVGIKDA
jgi:hypothetical protein